MKNFTLLCCLLFCGILSAQVQDYNLPIGQDTKVSIDARSYYQLDYGYLDGDFSKIKGQQHVQVKGGELMIRDTDRAVCYTTKPIDVSNAGAFKFGMFFSGEGSLDGANGGKLKDWIDVYYILDGEQTRLGDGEHTMEGRPQERLQQDWVSLDQEEKVELKVCMRMTGGDEQYTLHQIQFSDRPKEKTVSEAINNLATTTRSAANNAANTNLLAIANASLKLYPNPTTDWLEISNAGLFDLSKVEITNASGQVLRMSSTSTIDVKRLAAGEYFLRAPLKEDGTYLVEPFIVVR